MQYCARGPFGTSMAWPSPRGSAGARRRGWGTLAAPASRHAPCRSAPGATRAWAGLSERCRGPWKLLAQISPASQAGPGPPRHVTTAASGEHGPASTSPAVGHVDYWGVAPGRDSTRERGAISPPLPTPVGLSGGRPPAPLPARAARTVGPFRRSGPRKGPRRRPPAPGRPCGGPCVGSRRRPSDPSAPARASRAPSHQPRARERAPASVRASARRAASMLTRPSRALTRVRV